jgi:hypothetical protein
MSLQDIDILKMSLHCDQGFKTDLDQKTSPYRFCQKPQKPENRSVFG